MTPRESIESYPLATGWAVFVGSEGDFPGLFGVFPSKADAEFVASASSSDGDILCDPCVVPAAIRDGSLLVCNHFEVDTIEGLLRVIR